MFKNELKNKLKLPNKMLLSTVSILNDTEVVVCGVKTVLLTTSNVIRLRLNKKNVEVVGENLKIVEIGGGDAYIKGEIVGVNFV